MANYIWKKNDKKSINLQSGDSLTIQGISASELKFELKNGHYLFNSADSSLSLSINNAANSLSDLSKISVKFEDGSKLVVAADGGEFILDYYDTLILSGGTAKTIYGTIKNDVIYGTENNDKLFTNGGADHVYAGDGDDKIDGTSYFDSATRLWKISTTGLWLDAGAGDDTIFASAGDDSIFGGAGNDKIYGNGGKDQIDAGAGDDLIDVSQYWDPTEKKWLAVSGGANILAGSGDDTVYGGLGDDTIDGGSGKNYLAGGLGNDSYLIRSRFDRIYDSGGSADKGLIYANWFKTSPDIEQWSWAEGVEKLPYWLDALSFVDTYSALYASATTVVNYRFVETAPSGFSDTDKLEFQAFTKAQRDYAVKIFDYVSSIINVKFVETKDVNAKQVLAIANNKQISSGGYANSFVSNDFSKILISNRSDILNPDKNNAYAFNSVFIHELGHVLGLKHPFSHTDAIGQAAIGPFLPDSEENKEWSVMSYTDTKNKTPSDKFSPFDIAALQSVFGVATNYESGNNTYKLSETSTNIIFDGGGDDIIDGSEVKAALTLNLEPGYWSYIGKKTEKISDPGQITINFGTQIESIKGSNFADTLTGNSGNNRIYAGAGNDTISGGNGGYDLLDGGEGKDLAIVVGKRADYNVFARSNDNLVTAKDGKSEISLQNIELLKFDDVYVSFDYQGSNGMAYRLYQAAFDRKPDAAGMGYWMQAFEKGAKLLDVADSFVRSAEFQKLLGSAPSNTKIVDSFYKNVLHRTPDQAGYDYWLDQLNNNKISVAGMLASFSESTENQAQVLGQIQNGIDYLPWLG